MFNKFWVLWLLAHTRMGYFFFVFVFSRNVTVRRTCSGDVKVSQLRFGCSVTPGEKIVDTVDLVVRIPMISTGHSDRSRPVIPIDPDHLFRRIATTSGDVVAVWFDRHYRVIL